MMINIFKDFSLSALNCVCIIPFYSISLFHFTHETPPIITDIFSGGVIFNFVIVMYYSIYSYYSYKEFLLGKNIVASFLPCKNYVSQLVFCFRNSCA